MRYQDRTYVCRDCHNEFPFSAKLQEEFEELNLPFPNQCPKCHELQITKRPNKRTGAVEIFKAPCSKCGKEARLRTRPRGNTPILCADCFKNQLSPDRTPVVKYVKTPKMEVKPITVTEPKEGIQFSSMALDAQLLQGIQDAGYDTPTPVQAATIPIALAGHDLIGTAQTGTGKTAAFVIPIIQHLLANPVSRHGTRAIILTPTRELAEQINGIVKQLSRHTKLRSATVYGGVGMRPQILALRGGTEIIIACPGRLMDHMERRNTNFAQVDMVVLDEADRMLDMGFLPGIKQILASMPEQRQGMLFSATFAPELTKLANSTLKEPKRVDISLQAPPKTISHALYPCPQHLKTSMLLRMLKETDTNSVLIFTRTRHRASKLAAQIRNAGYGTAELHSDRSQIQRQHALDDFKQGRCSILVATDIAARGLDVATISHVMNFDIPDTADAYIHRVGRTGRMEREGDAITLVTPADNAMVATIERALGTRLKRQKLEGFDYDSPSAYKEDYTPSPASQYKATPDRVQSKGYARSGVTTKSARASSGFGGQRSSAKRSSSY
ncbi:MAG: DEAD/DEAH box helicase [Armatimonadota bacterium]